jgi:hypothetical protein
MKVYCVYGVVEWEGEFYHTYFSDKCNAEEFKTLWDADLRYMDSVEVAEVEILSSVKKSELKDILSKINK